MDSAKQSVDINASIERVFDVVVDFEKYPLFVPNVTAARVEKSEGGIYVASFSINVVKRIDYTLELTTERPSRVRWKLVRGDYMSHNDGGWDLAKLDDNRTHATYFIELKLGALVPKSLATMLAGRTLPETLQRFKERAERLAT